MLDEEDLYRPPFYEEYESDEPETTSEDAAWLAAGWNKSRNNPANICKFIRGVGLVTVFSYGGRHKLVAGGEFYGPFETQVEAQLAARKLRA
jgi:hypothetical protein